MERILGVVYFEVGMSPVTALSLTILGLWTLPIGMLLLVAPSAALGVACAVRHSYCRRLALKGLMFGVMAVFLYDCMRVPFIWFGWWGDFIPKIGGWLLATAQPNWLVGYLYRYIGDGGFMGSAFTSIYAYFLGGMDKKRTVMSGIIFGVLIWVGLLINVVATVRGAEMLFKLTPITEASSDFSSL